MLIHTAKVHPDALKVMTQYHAFPSPSSQKKEFKYDKKKVLYKNQKQCQGEKYLITISKLERDV